MYFNISLKKHENNISVSDKTGFHPFSLLNFLGAAILDFMTCYSCSIKELLMNNNYSGPGNLKAKIVHNHI